ncbi:D-alanyl-D-alanine carboxypeptidase family protein [Halanaerobacter jeridensis]|uniref:serine-type D-Ala-D-Ala carboxypeptidase n=1 Tax=Halanaerobacter jeridensis TaxID=706427 RepID=A0A939BNH7_9FIRM|nr:D-alanyl-D-alanine carboxypeptidase (penicillin-binding protein 5/6) [Halanaerobacter jeridensis]
MVSIAKKNKLLFSILFLFCLLAIISKPVTANRLDFELKSESAVLMEFNSGRILYEKKADKKLSPASITKIMTMLLVMEALEEDRIKLTDQIMVSEHAASMGGSQIWLEPGEKMELEELLKAVAIVSANDACVAIAEYLCGREEEFIEQMNLKAKELGMKNTKFYNTNGLPIKGDKEKGNYTTAHDIALMTKELLQYPQILNYTSVWIDHLRDGDSFLRNTNKLVRFYEGADGVKTGYTSEAEFCLSATAKKDGLRFISVIMKAPSSQVRFEESKLLLSSAFNIYRSLLVVKADEIIGEIKVFKGEQQEVTAVSEKGLTVSFLKGEENKLLKRTILKQEVTAPIKKGDKIGKILVFKGEERIGSVNLVAQDNVKKASFLKIITNLFTKFVSNLIV